MTMAAGTDVSGTGASTVKIPATEIEDCSLETSASSGSLKTTECSTYTVGVWSQTHSNHQPDGLNI